MVVTRNKFFNTDFVETLNMQRIKRYYISYYKKIKNQYSLVNWTNFNIIFYTSNNSKK